MAQRDMTIAEYFHKVKSICFVYLFYVFFFYLKAASFSLAFIKILGCALDLLHMVIFFVIGFLFCLVIFN